MRTALDRFKRITCIATFLLLCITVVEIGIGRSQIAQCTCHTEEATLSAPDDDIFTLLQNTNRWGLSANTHHLQVPAGNSLPANNTQHTARVVTTHLNSYATTENLCHTLCRTIASIRFHIGYFIYHRCQMRC